MSCCGPSGSISHSGASSRSPARVEVFGSRHGGLQGKYQASSSQANQAPTASSSSDDQALQLRACRARPRRAGRRSSPPASARRTAPRAADRAGPRSHAPCCWRAPPAAGSACAATTAKATGWRSSIRSGSTSTGPPVPVRAEPSPTSAPSASRAAVPSGADDRRLPAARAGQQPAPAREQHQRRHAGHQDAGRQPAHQQRAGGRAGERAGQQGQAARGQRRLAPQRAERHQRRQREAQRRRGDRLRQRHAAQLGQHRHQQHAADAAWRRSARRPAARPAARSRRWSSIISIARPSLIRP